jgi:hypothetical protein
MLVNNCVYNQLELPCPRDCEWGGGLCLAVQKVAEPPKVDVRPVAYDCCDYPF